MKSHADTNVEARTAGATHSGAGGTEGSCEAKKVRGGIAPTATKAGVSTLAEIPRPRSRDEKTCAAKIAKEQPATESGKNHQKAVRALRVEITPGTRKTAPPATKPTLTPGRMPAHTQGS